MAVNETIVTGRKWRRCIDVANKLWQRISYWTKASDVEFDDGQTAETKMGAISGITSDLNGESENIAASIKAVNQLNSNLTDIIKIVGYNAGTKAISPNNTSNYTFDVSQDGYDAIGFSSITMNGYVESNILSYGINADRKSAYVIIANPTINKTLNVTLLVEIMYVKK